MSFMDMKGLDEISVCAPTRVSELNNGFIRTYDISPEQLLGRTADPIGHGRRDAGRERRDNHKNSIG